METNIVFKSNLYPLFEYRSEKDIRPYEDVSFVNNVFSPEKLKQIKEKTTIRFKQEQEKCIEASAICVKAKSYLKTIENPPQYWVFRGSENAWKDACKCPFIQCSLFEKCRPGQKEKAKNECKARKNLKQIKQTEIMGYPVIRNLNRIFERYDTNAYALIDNADIKQHIENIELRIGDPKYDGNSRWENFDLGTNDRNFNVGLQSKRIEEIPLTLSDKNKKNPMLELQRKSDKNKNNVFFKQFLNKNE